MIIPTTTYLLIVRASSLNDHFIPSIKFSKKPFFSSSKSIISESSLTT